MARAPSLLRLVKKKFSRTTFAQKHTAQTFLPPFFAGQIAIVNASLALIVRSPRAILTLCANVRRARHHFVVVVDASVVSPLPVGLLSSSGRSAERLPLTTGVDLFIDHSID